MKRVLIIGASSAIAEACARLYAAQGAAIVLLARDMPRLGAIAADLRVRGAVSAQAYSFDALRLSEHTLILEQAIAHLGGLDVALLAYGTLSDQKACQESPELLRREFEINALSVMGLCTVLAQTLIAQGRGSLAVISSVAGDRGRASNYVYGAAKSAVTAFLSGLRQRVLPMGVHVLTIKPGFVDTPMTAHFKKGALWARPSRVAADIVKAIDRRQPVLYTPWFWWGIMLIIRAIPERLFMKLNKL